MNGEYVTHIDGRMITILSWQIGIRKYKSIGDQHFEILGNYMARLHSFSIENHDKIATNHRQYWTPDNLIGSTPVLGSYAGLEKIKGFDRDLFEAARLQTLSQLKNHHSTSPEKFGMIHADLHFGNILWHKGQLRAIDFDDCGVGSYLHDLSIPIVTTYDQSKSNHHRDILLNAYGKIHSLSQADVSLIDDYILSRYIAMQGWLLTRSDLPEIKKYLAQGMAETMEVLKKGLK